MNIPVKTQQAVYEKILEGFRDEVDKQAARDIMAVFPGIREGRIGIADVLALNGVPLMLGFWRTLDHDQREIWGRSERKQLYDALVENLRLSETDAWRLIYPKYH